MVASDFLASDFSCSSGCLLVGPLVSLPVFFRKCMRGDAHLAFLAYDFIDGSSPVRLLD